MRARQALFKRKGDKTRIAWVKANGEARATQASRRSHLAASADRDVDSRFPPRRPLGPARLVLRSQRIQVYAQGVKANILLTHSLPLIRVIALRFTQSVSLTSQRSSTLNAPLNACAIVQRS